ncbi:hypothetical protein KC19_5G094900 [Ceratodon purpureus]|uniref:Uncharacterized protein n=1 Tax=Ceratodon purpureus TaxID=3225 RepID=A0A8T0HZM7_CERPU|nr:hypothetical protein KC19_5G094900 [Ceratodon purpureus]
MARETDPIYGVEGEFCVNQAQGGVLDNNRPPRTQPNLNCDWALSKDGAKLQWSGMEKFYGYTEWLCYIITRVIPEGTLLNGEVKFAGEDAHDKGVIQIVDNRICVIPHGGEQLQHNVDPEKLEDLGEEDYRDVLLILQSLEHYRVHHDWTLGLPLKIDYYISYMLDVQKKLSDCTLPAREWITGKDGDVTQAIYFSVLLNPALSEQDVETALRACKNIFGIQDERSLPKASLVQEYWKTSTYFSNTTFRCPWKTSWGIVQNTWTYLHVYLEYVLRDLEFKKSDLRRQNLRDTV